MRILLLHNYYQQSGGEDRVFEAESNLLSERGHEVIRFTRSNDEIKNRFPGRSLADAVWNRGVAAELRVLLREKRPDLAHVHNVFSVLSPAVYHVLHDAGVPVVQTLHNLRFACPNARLMRGGKECRECLGRAWPWPGIMYRCYQGRLASSLGMVTVLAAHRLLRTWTRKIDLYLAPSDYVRREAVKAGLNDDRIMVKPHFVSDPVRPSVSDGGYALFAGRLEREKGVLELIDAWRQLPGFRLRIAGDGDLRTVVQARLREQGMPHVELLGWLSDGDLEHEIAQARFLVMPSLGPESFGLSVARAYSYGVPVLASPAGALREAVRSDETGLVVDVTAPADMATAARRLYTDDALRARLSYEARQTYVRLYSVAEAHRAMMNAYARASGHEFTATNG